MASKLVNKTCNTDNQFRCRRINLKMFILYSAGLTVYNRSSTTCMQNGLNGHFCSKLQFFMHFISALSPHTGQNVFWNSSTQKVLLKTYLQSNILVRTSSLQLIFSFWHIPHSLSVSMSTANGLNLNLAHCDAISSMIRLT